MAVGPKRKKFYLHKDLLFDRSKFFERKFNRRFRKGKNIFLPEESVADFETFARWLYGATLSTPTAKNVHSFIDLYIMAEYFRVESLMNTSMDLIRQGDRRGC